MDGRFMPDASNGEIVIRPAGPDQADIAGTLFYDTHPMLFDDLFGTDRALIDSLCATKWESPDTIDSHALAHGAYVDDVLIGVEIGGTNKEAAAREAHDDEVAKEFLGDEKFDHMSTRWQHAWQYCFPKFGADTYYVGTLSVSPDWHGKGVGRLLMQAAFDRARADGFRDVQLDLYDTNLAFHFYQAVGMDVLARVETPQLAALGFPNHIRMIKLLI